MVESWRDKAYLWKKKYNDLQRKLHFRQPPSPKSINHWRKKYEDLLAEQEHWETRYKNLLDNCKRKGTHILQLKSKLRTQPLLKVNGIINKNQKKGRGPENLKIRRSKQKV